MRAAAALILAVFVIAACEDDEIDPGAMCRRGCGIACPGGAAPTQSELVMCLQTCDASAAFADRAECSSQLNDVYGCEGVDICHSTDSSCDETHADYTRCIQPYCKDHPSNSNCGTAWVPSP